MNLYLKFKITKNIGRGSLTEYNLSILALTWQRVCTNPSALLTQLNSFDFLLVNLNRIVA